MNRGTLTTDPETGGLVVEAPNFYSDPSPRLKQKEDWVNLDRRGNWLDYRDAVADGPMNSDERIERRVPNAVNAYIDIHPDAPEDGDPCPAGSNSCPSPVYDNCGNMTFDPLGRVAGQVPNVLASAGMGPGQEFLYDFENRVASIHRDASDGQANGNATTNSEPLVMSFVYDALGRRVETKEYVDAATGTTTATPKVTRHVYNGLENLQDWLWRTSVQTPGYYVERQYLWGDPERYPEPLAMLTPFESQTPPGEPIEVEQAWHYLHDVLGSVIGLVDWTGKLVERYTYDPYGKVYIEKWNPAANENQGGWEPTFEPTSGLPYSAYGNPWMWTGQRYDAAIALYHFPERTYSPLLGRWLQRDPIEYAAGTTNLYEYVLSSPLFWIDPLGLDQMPSNDSTSINPDPVPVPTPVWNPGGHHWVPKSVARKHADDLSDEAAKVFHEAKSGGTDPRHNNRTMDGVTHPDYSNEVNAELEEFKKKRGINRNRKMSGDEAKEFVEFTKNPNCPNEKIKRFNKAIREEVEKAAKKAAEKGLARSIARRATKGTAGKIVPLIGVGFFIYDWYDGGFGHAVNQATWPLSELWTD